MQRKKGKAILIYDDFARMLESMTDAQVGQTIKALIELKETGAEPVINDGVVNIVFQGMKLRLIEDMEKYAEKCEKMSQNAKARYINGADENPNKGINWANI